MSSKANKKGSIPKIQEKAPETNFPISVNKTGNATLKILAKPGSKFNQITNICENEIGIQISAPPIDGEANTELIKFLSKVLEIRKSDLSLERGSKSRHKIVIVDKESGLGVDKITQLLNKNIQQK